MCVASVVPSEPSTVISVSSAIGSIPAVVTLSDHYGSKVIVKDQDREKKDLIPEDKKALLEGGSVVSYS